MIEIKQYGLMRTGTNLIRLLLVNNFDVTVHMNVGGWKHGHHHVKYLLGRDMHCIVNVKDPYAWLVSVYKFIKKNLNHKVGSFEQFLVKQWEIKENDIVLVDKTPMDHWNNMLTHFLNIKLPEHKLVFVKAEELITDQASVLLRLKEQLGLTQTTKELELLERRINPLKGTNIPSKKEINKKPIFNTSYYKDKSYMKEYSPRMLKIVKDALDKSIIERFGYSL